MSLASRQANCVCDTAIYKPTCPVCPHGQSCEGELVALPCGKSCLSNTCKPDGSGSGGGASTGGTIGGAVGGALAVLAFAALAFFLWRRRDKRKKAAIALARNEAKVRAAAGEKFRPGERTKRMSAGTASVGGQSTGSGGADAKSARSGLAPSTTGASSVSAAGASAVTAASAPAPALDQLEEVDEEEVEYTELRPDGLTTFKKGEDEQDTLGDLVGLGAGLNRRYSTSAATHLSRISEGMEYEDDDATSLDSKSIRAGAPERAACRSARRCSRIRAEQATSPRYPPASICCLPILPEVSFWKILGRLR